MRDPCPTTDTLEALLLGRTDDAAVERHVADCPRCAARLAAVGGEDAFTVALRAASPALACAAEPAVGALIERLRDLPVNGDTPPPAATLADGPPFDPADTPDEIGRLGTYRLLRELGRGGTGVVYLAWHEPLKREVAVKLLAADPTAGDRLARFRREAELVARLRHPNVVPVYEVGEWSGRPYFAMEYVAGGTLAERLAAAPLPALAAAELVETLARAVQAAHEAGVLHRDLKPANVLLGGGVVGSCGGEGQSTTSPPHHLTIPKVADFGLAKALDAGGATFDTRSGAVLGTPGYLAPEQLAGTTLGPTADVYSLGAILYECLTGRPPFKAATVLETLDQARTQDPPPPGRLQPGLPRDLQTVCLKCLDREPRRRYATASAFADDLRRFLDGRPVVARPAAWWERAAKWARRRPAAAGLVAASVVFLTTLAAGSLAYQARLRREVTRADVQYREARQALQGMLDRVRQRAASGIPQVKELERAQLEHALAFYQRAAEQFGDAADIRADAAGAALEAGRLQLQLGRKDDAVGNLERARDAFAALAAEFPNRTTYRERLAVAWTNLGHLQKTPADAARCARESLTLYEALAREDPASVEFLAGRAMGHHNLGGAECAAGRYDDAVAEYRTAEALREELLRRSPDDLAQRTALAETQLNLSLVAQTTERGADMVVTYRERAEATLTEALRRAPGDATAARSLAILRVNGSYNHSVEGRTDAALAELAKNVPLLEPLLAREPTAAALRDALFRTYGARASALDAAGRSAEAAAAWRRVVELAPPEVAPVQRVFLATALAAAGDHAAAFAEVEAAAGRPECREWRYQFHLCDVCCRAAAAAPPAEAERYLGRAVELLAGVKAALDAAEWSTLRAKMAQGESFAPLRGRADFQRLVAPP